MNLITDYEDAVNTICEEVDKSVQGDEIVFSLYIWEPGESSDCILAKLDDAAKRGVKILFDIDHSYVVRFARLVEKTESFIGKLKELAKKYPNKVGCTKEFHPNHKKYYLFKRGSGESTLIFGSMNLGDRFKDWKDLLVSYRDEEIGTYVYRRFVEGEIINYSKDKFFSLVANEPDKKIFEIREKLASIFGDEKYFTFTVITPYIDHRGIDLMQKAVSRGARIDLILPANANIYQQANLRTLSEFSKFENVNIHLYKKMIHIKAVLAEGAESLMSCVGSANLKRNSFDTLGELNAIINDQNFNSQLKKEMTEIVKDSTSYVPMPYKIFTAYLEELLG